MTEQEMDAKFSANQELIALLKNLGAHRSNPEAAKLLAALKAEQLEILNQIMTAHPEAFTQMPNGKWRLTERQEGRDN